MPVPSDLQTEIGKRHPFDLLEQEVSLNLARTQDVLKHDFERLFDEHGISGSQYNVLRILRGHGPAGTTCQEIARQMIHRTPDVTRLCDRLEQAGLLIRQRIAKDRRMVLAKITPAGLKLLKQLDLPVMRTHERQLGHFSRKELQELNRLLVKARRPPAHQTDT